MLLGRVMSDPVRFDRILAAALSVALLLEAWLSTSANGHRVAVSIGGLVTTAAVAFRRRYPAEVGIGVSLLSVAMQSAWPSALVSYGVAWICCMYAFSVWTATRTFVLGLVAYVSAALIAALLPFRSGSTEHRIEQTVPFIVVSTIVMVVVRQGIGARDRRVHMAERERDLAAREAVVEERARIARELHDVIAHNVSMMVVQAGAERARSTTTAARRARCSRRSSRSAAARSPRCAAWSGCSARMPTTRSRLSRASTTSRRS